VARFLVVENHHGFKIVARCLEHGWQARIVGIGALSDYRSTAQDAIAETRQYLDDQASERRAAGD